MLKKLWRHLRPHAAVPTNTPVNVEQDVPPAPVARDGSAMEAQLEENKALKAQLSNVGLELQAARAELEGIERQKTAGKNSATAQYQRRKKLILLPRLVDLLPANDRFLIVDGGAREVDRDLRWHPFPPRRLKFVGFEPDQAEAARLNATPGPGGLEWHFVPAGLWGSSGTIPFEHNKAPGGSSFLPQNRAVTDRWKFENPSEVSLAKDMFFPTGQEDMKVVSLAEWAGEAKLESVDFLKLNVQGGEHEILNGAGSVLDDVLGVLIEVAFVESYKKRPFFADTDQLLRGRGFTFFDLLAHHYIGRSATPVTAQHLEVQQPGIGQLVSSWGQLIEGHALYFRDPIADDRAAKFAPHRLIKLAVLAEAFGQVEYAFELLEWLMLRSDVKDTPMATAIRRAIDGGSAAYNKMRRGDLPPMPPGNGAVPPSPK